jgi:hypothetical protein
MPLSIVANICCFVSPTTSEQYIIQFLFELGLIALLLGAVAILLTYVSGLCSLFWLPPAYS